MSLITVCILIDGNPVVARNALNLSEITPQGETKFRADSGEIVLHKKSDGIKSMAHKLIDLIKNDETIGLNRPYQVQNKQVMKPQERKG